MFAHSACVYLHLNCVHLNNGQFTVTLLNSQSVIAQIIFVFAQDSCVCLCLFTTAANVYVNLQCIAMESLTRYYSRHACV